MSTQTSSSTDDDPHSTQGTFLNLEPSPEPNPDQEEQALPDNHKFSFKHAPPNAQQTTEEDDDQPFIIQGEREADEETEEILIIQDNIEDSKFLKPDLERDGFPKFIIRYQYPRDQAAMHKRIEEENFPVQSGEQLRVVYYYAHIFQAFLYQDDKWDKYYGRLSEMWRLNQEKYKGVKSGRGKEQASLTLSSERDEDLEAMQGMWRMLLVLLNDIKEKAWMKRFEDDLELGKGKFAAPINHYRTEAGRE